MNLLKDGVLMKTVLGRGGDQKSDVVSRLDKPCWTRIDCKGEVRAVKGGQQLTAAAVRKADDAQPRAVITNSAVLSPCETSGNV